MRRIRSFKPSAIVEQERRQWRKRLDALGFPRPAPRPEEASLVLAAPRVRSKARFEDRDGVAMATVCTVNHLHFAKTLVDSFRVHHQDAAVFVLVLDWDGVEELDVPGATLLSPEALSVERFAFMALKYSATDMCCAMKPYLLEYLIRETGYAKLVYLDADTRLFAPMTRLLTLLDDHPWIVTPHTLSPLPYPDRFWERPSLGDLAGAGVFNAGVFALVAQEETLGFIAQWRDMVTEPGAFLKTQGLQMEQHAFNWVSCFLDGVFVLRDTAYNAAYWNLHDRSLRWKGLDGADEDGWTVDGCPLVVFHFSGFSLDLPTNVSRFDTRHSLYVMPSLARLFEFYAHCLYRNGAATLRKRSYRYGAFASGVKIDDRMRDLFKQFEVEFSAGIDPWTDEGEAFYCRCLLAPVPHATGLLPALLHTMYEERPDLRALCPDAFVNPDGVLQWFSRHGETEYGYVDLFSRHRPVLPRRFEVDSLEKMRWGHPSLFEGIREPLGAGRPELQARLCAWPTKAGKSWEDTQSMLGQEKYFVSHVAAMKDVILQRTDVSDRYPDVLYGDAPRVAEWARRCGTTEHSLPLETGDVFLRKAQGRALARVFSYVSRTWPVMERWPLAFVGVEHREFAEALLRTLRRGLEYDAEDIVMYLWVMEVQPWKGLPLALELPVNVCRQTSALLPEGQASLLASVLQADPRFADALAVYRKRYQGGRFLRQEEEVRRASASRSVETLRSLAAVRSDRGNGAGRVPPPDLADENSSARRAETGVNLFGFFKSPIGLGNMSRGLSAALESARIPRTHSILTNVSMDADLCPEDLIRTYESAHDTNIFVSCPHAHERLLGMYPPSMTQGRRNISYLAWEQRDGSHYWSEIYAEYDQIWALSSFAAESLARCLNREVLAVPCVIDVEAFPDPANKKAVGLDPSRFTFLYVYDANSAIVRKNPEAAIEAFAKAFSSKDKARLVLKISNSGSIAHRHHLTQLLRKVSEVDRDIQLLAEDMPRDRALQLISAVDCYVSTHRAEGFALTCAEAMAFGKPVIATNYSGNLQFMNAENSYLIDYEEVEVAVPDGPFQRGSVWADPSVEHAAELMRQVYEDHASAAAIGRRAQATIRENLSPQAVGKMAAKALAT